MRCHSHKHVVIERRRRLISDRSSLLKLPKFVIKSLF